MTHTKPQERLLTSLKRGQKVQYLIGGGWRLMDGTPIHPRTIQSLASRGEIEPAGTDLLGDRVPATNCPTPGPPTEAACFVLERPMTATVETLAASGPARKR